MERPEQAVDVRTQVAFDAAMPCAHDLQRLGAEPMACLDRWRRALGDLYRLDHAGPLLTRDEDCPGVVVVFGEAYQRAVLTDIERFVLPESAARTLGLPPALRTLNAGLHGMRGDRHEHENARHAQRDRAQRASGGPVAADAGVQQRRDDERDRPQGLDEDERSERQRRQLADDRQTQHDGADHPRRPAEEVPALTAGEAGAAVGGGEPLDLLHTAVLVLRAERHEDRAQQGQRNADQDAGVGEHADELVGDVVE